VLQQAIQTTEQLLQSLQTGQQAQGMTAGGGQSQQFGSIGGQQSGAGPRAQPSQTTPQFSQTGGNQGFQSTFGQTY
jgi:hypothetical protein